MALARAVADRRLTHAVRGSSASLYQHLESLLISGGDARLAQTEPQCRNAYGCTPFPRAQLLDFGSATASSISERAYDRAFQARSAFLGAAAVLGVEAAFEAAVERQRAALKTQFAIPDAEIVFAPSGTDAQLQALFLVMA
jgi:hypothetical protein